MSTVRNLPAKPAPPTETKRPAREKSGSATWSRWVRVLVSLLIAWHLLAVFLGPFSIPPTSESIFNLAQSPLLSWYIRPLYLHHGYHFFAPDPGASSLVRYRVTGKDGKEITGQLPDLERQRPRLRYHRYLMLAEQAKLAIGNEPIEQRVQAMLRVYAQQLLREYDGTEARVEYVIHDMLSPGEVRDGMKLDDPRTFRVVEVVTQTATDLEAPLVLPHRTTSDSNWQAGESTPPGSGQ